MDASKLCLVTILIACFFKTANSGGIVRATVEDCSAVCELFDDWICGTDQFDLRDCMEDCLYATSHFTEECKDGLIQCCQSPEMDNWIFNHCSEPDPFRLRWWDCTNAVCEPWTLFCNDGVRHTTSECITLCDAFRDCAVNEDLDCLEDCMDGIFPDEECEQAAYDCCLNSVPAVCADDNRPGYWDCESFGDKCEMEFNACTVSVFPSFDECDVLCDHLFVECGTVAPDCVSVCQERVFISEDQKDAALGCCTTIDISPETCGNLGSTVDFWDCRSELLCRGFFDLPTSTYLTTSECQRMCGNIEDRCGIYFEPDCVEECLDRDFHEFFGICRELTVECVSTYPFSDEDCMYAGEENYGVWWALRSDEEVCGQCELDHPDLGYCWNVCKNIESHCGAFWYSEDCLVKCQRDLLLEEGCTWEPLQCCAAFDFDPQKCAERGFHGTGYEVCRDMDVCGLKFQECETLDSLSFSECERICDHIDDQCEDVDSDCISDCMSTKVLCGHQAVECCTTEQFHDAKCENEDPVGFSDCGDWDTCNGLFPNYEQIRFRDYIDCVRQPCENDPGPGVDDTECEQWAIDGQCDIDENPAWMRYHCQRDCYTCGCIDDPEYAEDCPGWEDEDQCEENAEFMDRRCTESCGGCQRGSTTPTRRPPSTRPTSPNSTNPPRGKRPKRGTRSATSPRGER